MYNKGIISVTVWLYRLLIIWSHDIEENKESSGTDNII